MVNLTAEEVKSIMIDFAERYCQARQNGTDITVDELATSYYDVTVSILYENDPTRFISNN